MEFTVRIEWDPEASVWWVAESDVPGLVTEAPTVEQMFRKLEVMIPELLEANNVALTGEQSEVPFRVIAQGVARRAAA